MERLKLPAWLTGEQEDSGLSYPEVQDSAEQLLGSNVVSPGLSSLIEKYHQMQIDRRDPESWLRKSTAWSIIDRQISILGETIRIARETGEMPKGWQDILRGKF